MERPPPMFEHYSARISAPGLCPINICQQNFDVCSKKGTSAKNNMVWEGFNTNYVREETDLTFHFAFVSHGLEFRWVQNIS